MKKLAVFLVLGFLFSNVNVSADCLRTGFRYDASNAIDTVFFADVDTGLRFFGRALFIKLAEDASGPVTIRRGTATDLVAGAPITFVDQLGAVQIRPGGYWPIEDDHDICFYFSKTSATDKLIWEVNTCNKALVISSPPITPTSSNDTINVGTDTLMYGYRLENGTPGRWLGTRITIGPDAEYSSKVEWYYQGALTRTQLLWPGGSIYDTYLSDSIIVYKAADADTVQIGGQK